MNVIGLKRSVFCIAFISIIALLFSCGSSVENPTSSSDNDDQSELGELSVKIEIRPDEKIVELTATIENATGSQLFFKWVNVTGYGTLSNTDLSYTVWTAPDELNEIKVEVIHLVVIAVSQKISVVESKVSTDTEILTKTKTIPLTVWYHNGKLEVDLENE